MAGGAIDVRMFGGKALQRKLDALASPVQQRKAIKPALGKSARRLKKRVIATYQAIVDDRTGRLLAALKASPVKSSKAGRKRSGIFGWDWALPERHLLGIGDTDANYYPAFVEYGHGPPGSKGSGRKDVAPRSFIRSTVDADRKTEHRRIGEDIGKGIEKIARMTK